MAISKLYDNIVIPGPKQAQELPSTRTYRGFSTVSTVGESFALYDLALIKQDIINHFHIRQGERLLQPEFGTIIWDLLFEPLTENVKALITKDIENIINYDPRVRADQVIVHSYESGIQVECSITYLPYNISESIRLTFDQNNGLIN